MHALAALVGLLAAVLYGYRTGTLISYMGAWEIVARAGVGLSLASLSVGFAQRWLTHAEFEPIHWPILVALTVTVGGYVGLFWPHRQS